MGHAGVALILFRDGGDGQKAETLSGALRGAVLIAAFVRVAVEAVGGDDVEEVALPGLHGEGKAPRALRHGHAAGDGVFHEVPEQARHIEFRDGERLGQGDLPLGLDILGVRHRLIVIEQGV